jgi:hypothetical protein
MFQVGATKRITVVTKALNENGDLVQLDPATLSVTVRDPLGNLTTYVYGSDPEVVQWVEANYYLDVVPNLAGTWRWTWGATPNPGDVGTVVEPLDGSFLVEALPVEVTFHVDDGTDPVKGARVSVFSTRSYLTNEGVTAADGTVTLRLQPGDYLLDVEAPNVVFVGMEFTADGSDVSVSGVPFVPDAPTPEVVHLFGHVLTPEGRGDTTAVVVMSSLPLNPYTHGAGPSVNPATSNVTRAVKRTRPRSEDGYWQLPVIAGLMVRVRVPSTNYDKTFRVPSGTTHVNIADVRPDPGPTTSGIRTSRGAPGSSLVM